MFKPDIAWFETVLEQSENERCVHRVKAVRVDETKDMGNFSSDILRLTVDLILENGNETTRQFIVKTLPTTSENRKQFVVESKLFEREIHVYERVLNPLSRQCEFDGDERLWCTMIGYQPHHTIVFEDLSKRDFGNIVSKTSMLDRSEASLVLEALARYHALTVVAERRGVFDPAEFTSCLFTDEKYACRQISRLMEILSESIESFWDPKWQIAAQRIKRLSEMPEKFTSLRGLGSKLNVLNHGDLWSRNIMTKKENGHLVVNFVDFQCSHYDSFAWDVNRLLYNAVEPGVRREHYNELLRVYLGNLNDCLRLHSIEMDSPLTIHDVQQEMSRLQLFAFFHLFFNVALETCEVSDDIEDDWHVPEGKELGGLTPELYNCERFRSLVEPDLELFLANGTL